MSSLTKHKSVHTQLRRINCIISFYLLSLWSPISLKWLKRIMNARCFCFLHVEAKRPKKWHSSPSHPCIPSNRISTSIWSFASTLFILLNCHNFFPTINHVKVGKASMSKFWASQPTADSAVSSSWFDTLKKCWNLFRRWYYDDNFVYSVVPVSQIWCDNVRYVNRDHLMICNREQNVLKVLIRIHITFNISTTVLFEDVKFELNRFSTLFILISQHIRCHHIFLWEISKPIPDSSILLNRHITTANTKKSFYFEQFHNQIDLDHKEKVSLTSTNLHDIICKGNKFTRYSLEISHLRISNFLDEPNTTMQTMENAGNDISLNSTDTLFIQNPSTPRKYGEEEDFFDKWHLQLLNTKL